MVKSKINIIILCIIMSFFACDGLEEIFNENLPEIEGGLKVSNENPYPLDTINCSVTASNPVDGELEYYWEVSPNYGTFLNQSNDPASVKWIVPAEHGEYTLKVKVENTEGTSKASKKIEVLEAQQVIINGLIELSAMTVNARDTVIASVSAENPRPGPLEYEWTHNGGYWAGTADNATVYWVAPLIGGTYTLTVNVTNGLTNAQTSKDINVISSAEPIVNIISPVNNATFYLGDPINITAKAEHANSISLVRLYATTSKNEDSLIHIIDFQVNNLYNFTQLTAYEDLVGHSTIRVEAEAANQLQTKGSDQISIHVLGIHIGKNGRE